MRIENYIQLNLYLMCHHQAVNEVGQIGELFVHVLEGLVHCCTQNHDNHRESAVRCREVRSHGKQNLDLTGTRKHARITQGTGTQAFHSGALSHMCTRITTSLIHMPTQRQTHNSFLMSRTGTWSLRICVNLCTSVCMSWLHMSYVIEHVCELRIRAYRWELRASLHSHLSVENVVDHNAQPDDGDTRSQPLVIYKYIAHIHSRANSRMREMVTYSFSFELLWKMVA